MISKNSLKNHRLISNNIIIYLICAILFLGSFFIRLPLNKQYNYVNSDATWHVLLTLKAYDETSIKEHKFLPINTLGNENNKFINNGPSLITDKEGNNYYTSFSPAGFMAPYLFIKVLNLPINELSLYIFNSVLCILSIILSCKLFTKIFKDNINRNYIILITCIIYFFQNEVMQSQGIVYWHQSLFQVMLLLQLNLFTDLKNKKRMIQFLIVSILNPYIEWTGYIGNIGFALAFFIQGTKVENKNISISLTALKKSMGMIIASIVAFSIYTLHFLLNIPSKLFFSELKLRFFARGTDSRGINALLKGYINSYGYIIIIILIILIITLLNKETRNLLCKNIKENYLMWIVIAFPIIENFVMMNHAITYTFDRLKVIIFLILIFLTLFYVWQNYLENKVITYIIAFASLFIISITNIVSYGFINNNYIWEENYLEDNQTLANYIKSKYTENNSILVKEGWRSWGYQQSLYDRNIYCSDLYSVEECLNRAIESNKEYVIIFIETIGKWDKAKYTKCLVYDINNAQLSFVKVDDNGKLIINDKLNAIQVSILTDENWENGVSRKENKILLENTPYNILTLINSKKLSMNDNIVNILNIDYDKAWITIEVEDNKEIFKYPNRIEIIK